MNKYVAVIVCGFLFLLVSTTYSRELQFKILNKKEPIPSPSTRFITTIPEKEIYKTDEEVWVKIIIANNSEEEKEVYGHLQFSVVNNITREIYRPNMRESIPDILWIEQILKPSESITRRINLSYFNEFAEGEYKITFSFLPEESNDILYKEIILSNPVTIEIVHAQ